MLDRRRHFRRSRHHSSQRAKSPNIYRSSSAVIYQRLNYFFRKFFCFSLIKQRCDSSNKYLHSSSSTPCEIIMIYYGPHTKVDYDHLVFEPTDEITVMQQHCGGENLTVYKKHLKPGGFPLVLFRFYLCLKSILILI